jgi:putative ABC transport system permease protein
VTFTLVLSMLTAVVFGLVPLVAGTRRDLSDVLREGAARSTGGRRQHRLQSGLVVTSVAFAFVLLVGAGLLIKSFSNLMAIDSGMRAFNVLTMEAALPFAGYRDPARTRAFYRNLTDRLREIPGVKAVAIATDLPLKPDGERRAFTPNEQPNGAGGQSSIAVTWTHGDYFTTFGVPLLKGRNFAPEEQIENRRVMIVSKGLADRYWPGQDPIGKQIKWGLPQSTAPWQTVIGVAGDVDDGALGSEPFIHAYVPFSEVPDGALASPIAGLFRRMAIAVNGHVEAAELTTPVRSAVAAIDPALAVSKVETMAEVMSNVSAPQRFSAMLLTAFAAGALLLAGIGLYGVLAFGVSQRTREIGVRLALGAGRREVLGLVVRQGMLLVGIGLLLGGAGAIAATRVMKALLFETNVYDPWTFAIVPILLALVSLAACYMPARRAGRVDPMVALRTE